VSQNVDHDDVVAIFSGLRRDPVPTVGRVVPQCSIEPPLLLTAEGLANKAIGARLWLRLNTVRNHVQNVLVQSDAHSKLEAVAIAGPHGLLRPGGGSPDTTLRS
jgi:hypothetical protein